MSRYREQTYTWLSRLACEAVNRLIAKYHCDYLNILANPGNHPPDQIARVRAHYEARLKALGEALESCRLPT